MADCVSVAQTGADIVALDGTARPRPDGSSLQDCFKAIHAHGALVMADCGSLVDATASLEGGGGLPGDDIGWVPASRPDTRPGLRLRLRLSVAASDVPVLAEGRNRTPEDALRCLKQGAFAVVVGTAITHPTSITSRFARVLAGQEAHGAVYLWGSDRTGD